MLDFLLHKSEMTLFTAARAGDAARVREQLARKIALAGARVTSSQHKKHPEFDEGATALHLASRYGHAEVVEVLLTLKCDVNLATASGSTPLHQAAAGDHADVVAMLLDHQANAAAADIQGVTPLMEASRHGFDEVARLLLARSAPAAARNRDGLTALHMAAYCGSVDTVKLLLAARAEINVQDERGRSPLHFAVVASEPAPGHHPVNTEIAAVLILYLLEQGADPNLKDAHGESAFELLMSLAGQSRLASNRGLIEGFHARGAEIKQVGPNIPKQIGQSAVKPGTQSGAAPGSQAGLKPGTAAPTHQTVVGAAAPSATPNRSTIVPGAPARAASANGMPIDDRVSWGNAPIALGERAVTFGRDNDCDIRYLSRTLSRRHAKVERTSKGFVISDLGSRNGILVDQVKINGPTLLKANQVIELGAYEFRFDGFRLLPLHGELSPEQLAAEGKRNDPAAVPGKGTTLSPNQNTGNSGLLGAFKR